MTAWEENLPARFGSLNLEKIEIKGADGYTMICGEPISVNLHLHLGSMRAEEIEVQLVIGLVHGNRFISRPTVIPLEAKPADHGSDGMDYSITYTPAVNGHYCYGIRVVPVHTGLSSPLETGLVLWA